jgi:S-adenosylmethionine-diacylgycerolhomoserine-N-methlytransferase
MPLLADLKILWNLAVKPVRGASHQARLDSFYSQQSAGYDEFRKRLLHGREQLFQSLVARLPADRNDLVWLDLGGGTGSNIENLSPHLGRFKAVYIVDLSTSLLKVARERIEKNKWTNVHALEADVTTFTPPVDRVDVVSFSYSLTMIPPWLAAIDRAHQLLSPGGLIGSVDFFVGHKFPGPGDAKHGLLTRTGWPLWFGLDNVFLSPDILTALRHRFEMVEMTQTRSKVPYLPLVRVPYYQFVGTKR